MRVEIVVNGLVQGVGFRYFVIRAANKLNLFGFVKNLPGGEVFAVAEGEKYLLDEFVEKVKIGPMHARVKNFHVEWSDSRNEFNNFEVRY